MGSNHFRVDMPRLVEFYLNGKLHLDDWITAKLILSEINEGFADLKAGKPLRSVIHSIDGYHGRSSAKHKIAAEPGDFPLQRGILES